LYYLNINNKKSGPFSAEEVRLYLQKGAIENSTYFWCDGMMEWQTVGSAIHLFKPQRQSAQVKQPQYEQPQYQNSQMPMQQGQAQPVMVQPVFMYSGKSRVAYILLGLFLGGLGIHNFYAGYAGRGVAQLLLNLFLFWTLLVPVAVGVWVILQIIVVDRDSNGVRFS
jgi:TM2 domain-containing membrane protein YozV